MPARRGGLWPPMVMPSAVWWPRRCRETLWRRGRCRCCCRCAALGAGTGQLLLLLLLLLLLPSTAAELSPPRSACPNLVCAQAGILVVCCGGGGIPVAVDPGSGERYGVEAVVDKDEGELCEETTGVDGSRPWVEVQGRTELGGLSGLKPAKDGDRGGPAEGLRTQAFQRPCLHTCKGWGSHPEGPLPGIVAASALLGIKLQADWLLMLTGAWQDADQLTYCGARMLGCCLHI